MSRTALLPLLVSTLLTGPLAAQPHFIDATQEAGLAATPIISGSPDKGYILESTGSGAGFFDYDNDGDLDLYLVNGTTAQARSDSSGPGNALYRNDGKGVFTDIAATAGVAHRGWGAGLAVGDIDADADVDIYLTNYGANVLYRNDGKDTFTDIAQTNATAGDQYSAGAAFFDYDNDGDLDLYVANYVVFDAALLAQKPDIGDLCMYLGGIRVYCGPQGMEGARDILYRNDGKGAFTDITQQAGIAAANAHYGLGVVPADYNVDGHIDLFVANDETPNVLFRNSGDGTFTDVAATAGVAYNGDGQAESGMGVDAADYDGDGDVDFYVTNFYRETNTLYRNDGGAFVDATQEAGLAAPTLNLLGWGTRFFDYDSDGRLDLFVANGHVYPQVDQTAAGTGYAQRNQLFANVGGGRFAEVGSQAGPGLQLLRSSRGLAAGDYDNDGDTDLLVVNLDDRPDLLRNDTPRQHHWLAVQLEGPPHNRQGVGATLQLHTPDGLQWRQINGASGYLGHSDIRAYFGLGLHKEGHLEVHWPDGTTQNVAATPADSLLLVRYQKPALVRPLGGY
ncbi:MAG: hypothetical protein GKR89_05475 [Candidatus Latescibacteria bacterium]|nr:hypothetical protein [Candidatus Latescibacterota bacterium]